MGDLNRSRKERLAKAARLGFGPWAEIAGTKQTAPRVAGERGRRIVSPPRKQERGRDSTYAYEFLAHKPASTSHKKVDVPPPGIEMRISSGSGASSQPAKLEIRAPQAAELLRQRQREAEEAEARERAAAAEAKRKAAEEEAARLAAEEEEEREREQELEREREEMRREREGDRDEEADPAVEEARKRRREEKRKREDWRKRWKEEKRRRDEEEEKRLQHEQAMQERQAEKEKEENTEKSTHRANMWGLLNNNGLTWFGEVAHKPLGQLSDADLERRLKESEGSSSSQRLMTEAEVLAKKGAGKGSSSSTEKRRERQPIIRGPRLS